MLTQLAPYRVHLSFSAVLLAYFTVATLLHVLEGENLLWAPWASIKEVKLMEWVSLGCVWATIAGLVKENDQLRAKVQLLESRQ